MKIEGIIKALVTPFDAAGKVDEAALRRLVDFQVKGGVNGLFIRGHPRAPLKAMNTKEAGTLKEQLEKLGVL